MSLILKNNNKDEILKLYNSVFSGEEAFAERFFYYVWSGANCLSVILNGKTVSCANIIPYTLESDVEHFSAGYVYAAMTLPEYRGKGLMSELLGRSFELGHDFSILIVQNDGLLNYYSRFGYLPLGTVSETESEIHETDIEIRYAHESEYGCLADIYKKETSALLHIKRDAEEFSRISRVYDLKFLVESKDKNIDSYCFGYKENKTFIASEIMGQNGKKIAAAAARSLNCDKMICRGVGTRKAIGMIKPISERAKQYAKTIKQIYLNLAFN